MTPQTSFGRWLRSELDAREMGVRSLARIIAANRPGDGTVRSRESIRRSLNRYLNTTVLPSRRMRRLIAEGLEVAEGDMPDEDAEELARLPVSRARLEALYVELGEALGRGHSVVAA